MSESFSKVKGFRDIYGESTPYWHIAERTFKEIADLFNIQEIRLPILEQTVVFARGVGATTDIVEKEMFTFADRDSADQQGELLSLRPEGTAGTVRSYIENGMFNLPGVRKFFYLGPMFRREKPQKGRYRQFTQVGIEYLGTASALADADVINTFVTFFSKVGIGDLAHLEINSVGCPACRPAYHKLLMDFFSSHINNMCDDCKRRLDKNPLRILDCKSEKCRTYIKDAPLMLNHLCGDCVEHFEQVKGYLNDFGIKYTINPFMVRGLDYYVRTAFEMITDKLGAASAIGGGGRYDGLVEMLGGPKTPGVGYAIGVDRVVELMMNVREIPLPTPTIFIVTFGGETLKAGIKLADQFRKKGISVEFDYECKGMKNQMKQADRAKARYAVIIGEDELRNNQVAVKDLMMELDSNKQHLVPIDKVIEFFIH